MPHPFRQHRVLANRKWRSALLVGSAAALYLCQGAPSQAQFVIKPVFESSITSDPNAATIEASINNTIQFYESRITNNMTVTIDYQEMSSGLGESSTNFEEVTYSSWRAALAGEPTDTTKATALANLPNTTNQPVTNTADLYVEQAAAIALGLDHSADPTISTISINTSICNLSRPDTNSNDYDLESVVFHETDEALGTVSGLGTFGSPTAPDLYRYTSTGARTFTTSTSTNAYFSLNGTTDLDEYNTSGSGDWGDWIVNHPAQVQDYAGTPGASPNPNVELTVLDAVGYDFKVPAPDSLSIMGIGFALTVGRLRLKRRWARKKRLSIL